VIAGRNLLPQLSDGSGRFGLRRVGLKVNAEHMVHGGGE